MGRYYSGDIEGKFWFGVQPSDDATFFGASCTEPSYLECYADDLDAAKKGVKACLKQLGDHKARLDTFFKSVEFYNDEKIIEHYKSNYQIDVTENDIRELLTWYARLKLGKKIVDCIEGQGHCSFTAEL